MSAQVVLETPSATTEVPAHQFRVRAQDSRLNSHHQAQDGIGLLARVASTAPQTVDPPLGILESFKGTFAGTGFNSIFRPNSGPPTTTTFPIAVNFPTTGPGNDNVLELNLTTETLKFGVEGAPTIGSVPNRGEKPQSDIFLNGVPYLQQISDVTNPATGQADADPSGIHFESGLWMHVPATTIDPVLGDTLSRMASIPHGTTINAQCLAPTTSFPGGPKFPPVNMTPFPIGAPGTKIPFPSQTAANTVTPRLPQNLTPFIAAGTITQEILDNPNVVLEQANKGKTIANTTVFTVSTSPTAPVIGGGTDNIAFLQGTTTATPNALTVQMSATFWVNEVVHEIKVPILYPGQRPINIVALTPHPGTKVPTFAVHAPSQGTKTEKTIKVKCTEIQYSQVVFLNFAGLTWPHVSVATLVPQECIPVPDSALE